jgi:hypothetical protein
VRRRGAIEAILILLAVAGAMYVVATHIFHWGDWVVWGVLVVTAFGAAWAIYTPRYTTKRRTFVRSSKPPR